MAITYYKRFRMEITLGQRVPEPLLPGGYHWIAWNESLLGVHAEVKYRCFHSELDATLFPCLGDRYGCLRLMREIRRRNGFAPEATWLVACGDEVCGTIQGVLEPGPVGVIQNLGVRTEHRRQNLGRALLLKALCGFVHASAGRASLEVTAENSGAVKLYHSVGFRRARILYKPTQA